MQQLINQLPDEQLLDLFILIEDKHGPMAIDYLLNTTHFTRAEALAIVNFLIQQRNYALNQYTESSHTQTAASTHYRRRASDRLYLENELDTQINSDQKELKHQPLTSLSTMKDFGIENNENKSSSYFWICWTILSMVLCIIASIVIYTDML